MTLNGRRHLLSSHWTRATRSNPFYVLRDDTWTLGKIPRVSHDITLTTCRRHPRAKVFANLSFNFIKFPKDTFSRSHAYTDLHIYAQLSLNRHQNIYIYKYIYKYIYITRNCFIIPSDETERERDRENGVKNSDPFHDDYWKYVEMKFDRGSTHHDRRPLHLNYD